VGLLLLFFTSRPLLAQIRLNEGSNKNATQLADEDGEYDDWLELFNPFPVPFDLAGYALSDNASKPTKWVFGQTIIPADGFQVVFASAKNRQGAVHHWESPATADMPTWSYVVPDAGTTPGWSQLAAFPAVPWLTGIGYIGYGDGDDSTLVPAGTISVYMAHPFVVADTSKIAAMILHMDYDDGFIAYLNGVEIARSASQLGTPVWDSPADAQHEGTMYQGGLPEAFAIPKAVWRNCVLSDTNILAIEVHNVDAASSDFSAIPFLSIGLKDASTYWGPTPAWFSMPTGNLHTNFKISSYGETIYLFNPGGIMVDSLAIGNFDADYSAGCLTDGSTAMGIFPIATPNASNNIQQAYTGFEKTPVFSLNPGFYMGAQTVDIYVNTVAGQLRYTTNGEFPTLLNSLPYTAPLVLTANAVLKARCFNDPVSTLLAGAAATATYFINDSSTLPVIAISIDSLGLYGPDGIYDNWWTDWKKPCYIEYFDRNNALRFSQRAGIKIDGGAGGSRSQPQRSFRVEPDNGLFGDGSVNYPLFQDKPNVGTFETFYLRNGSNMYNVLPYKDAWMLSANYGTYNNFQAYEAVIVYLNGQYWGVYELREKQDKGYFKYNFGADQDSLDLLSVSYWYGGVLRTVEGSDTGFLAMQDTIAALDPTQPTFYAKADSLIDIAHFADYIIAQTWFGNTDWPYNNIKIWRSRATDNKWHYGLIDLEWGLGEGGWTSPYTDMIGFVLNTGIGGYGFIRQLGPLLQNTRFHDYFINRYADLMNEQYTYSRFKKIDKYNYGKIAPEMPRHYDRWGDGSPISDQMGTLDYFRQRMLDDFSIRTPLVRGHIESNFQLAGQVNITLDVKPAGAGSVAISTITPGQFPWTGVYFNGVPVPVSASPNPGFAFSHWEKSTFIADSSVAAFTGNITVDTVFTAVFLASPIPPITIGEINYNSEKSIDADDWVELLVSGPLPVSLDNWALRDNDDTHTFAFPKGITLQPNDRLVVVRDSVKFKTQHPSVPFIGQISFGFSGTTDQVRLVNGQGQVWASVTYVDSLFPPGADGRGRTLELANAAGSLDDPANWFGGCVGGSPGASYSPCTEPLILSEINYNSDALFNTQDWVEVRNTSNTPLDISGWVIRDNLPTEVFTLPQGTIIAPHENLVLAQDTAAFDSLWNEKPIRRAGPYTFNMSGSGDWIRLYDATGTLRISVVYKDNAPWATDADGGGYTLELADSLGLMDDGHNWFAGCPGGSPGAYYLLPCESLPTRVAPDRAAALGAHLAPNPTDGLTELRLALAQPAYVRVRLLDVRGKLIEQLVNRTMMGGEQAIGLDIQAFAAGVYLLEIMVGERKEVLRLVKQ